MANKHVRLDSQFNTVCAFWSPDATDDVQTGTLTTDQSGITFTTSATYSRQAPKGASVLPLGSRTATRFPVLHGVTGDGVCTLCQLVESGQPGLMDFRTMNFISATSYQAIACTMGLHIGGMDDQCLDSARYTFSGLSEWLPNAVTESWERDHIVLKLPLNERDLLTVGLREGHIEIGVKLIPTLTTSERDGGRLSKSVAFVEVRSARDESLSWYLHVGSRLENLFSLLVGASQAMETVFVYRGDTSGYVIQKRNGRAESFDPLDCVRCTTSQIANSIAIWLCQPPEFRSVENLALGIIRKGKLFAETELLSLAQALEGFHRVAELSAKVAVPRQRRRKTTFGTRLHELCDRLNRSLLARMQIDPTSFVPTVVATRNFYTHTGSSTRVGGKALPIEGRKLFLLNQKMRALLRGVMLLDLAIPEEQLSDLLVREATRWT
jgi:hypothetical protein